eukprot:165978-Rhodomonas_salina.2
MLRVWYCARSLVPCGASGTDVWCLVVPARSTLHTPSGTGATAPPSECTTCLRVSATMRGTDTRMAVPGRSSCGTRDTWA